MPIEVTFLRTDDIPVLCAEGAIDMGITGGDLIAETGVDLTSRLSLGMGNWKLAICVPEDSGIHEADRSGRADESRPVSRASRRRIWTSTRSRPTSSS